MKIGRGSQSKLIFGLESRRLEWVVLCAVSLFSTLVLAQNSIKRCGEESIVDHNLVAGSVAKVDVDFKRIIQKPRLLTKYMGGADSRVVCQLVYDRNEGIGTIKSGKLRQQQGINILEVTLVAPIFRVPTGRESDNAILFKDIHTYCDVVTTQSTERSHFTSIKKKVRRSCLKTEVVPAEYKTVTEKVLDKPTVREKIVIPATYKTVQKKVLSKKQSVQKIEVPAQYKNVPKSVISKPARYKNVEIPAQYNLKKVLDPTTGKTIRKRVLVTPKSNQKVLVAKAQYKTVNRKVLVTPKSTRQVVIPATYKTVSERVLEKPESIQWKQVPATYKTVTKQIVVSTEKTTDKEASETVIEQVIEIMSSSAANQQNLQRVLNDMRLNISEDLPNSIDELANTVEPVVTPVINPVVAVEPLPAIQPQPVFEDTDQDGVPDTQDRCPKTERGYEVTADGCNDSEQKKLLEAGSYSLGFDQNQQPPLKEGQRYVANLLLEISEEINANLVGLNESRLENMNRDEWAKLAGENLGRLPFKELKNIIRPWAKQMQVELSVTNGKAKPLNGSGEIKQVNRLEKNEWQWALIPSCSQPHALKGCQPMVLSLSAKGFFPNAQGNDKKAIPIKLFETVVPVQVEVSDSLGKFVQDNLFEIIGALSALLGAIGVFWVKKGKPIKVAQDKPKSHVLFLAANPETTNRMALDKESKAIEEAYRQSKYREAFDFKPHFAFEWRDLDSLIVEEAPNILHISSHGLPESGELVVSGNNGASAEIVGVDKIAHTLTALSGAHTIDLVVLNACFSNRCAGELLDSVAVVIGMSGEVSDQSAVIFSQSFYRALGDGRRIRSAYDIAVNEAGLTKDNGNPRILEGTPSAADKKFI